MIDRDRLAADLHEQNIGCEPHRHWSAPTTAFMHNKDADRLIALGWTRKDRDPLSPQWEACKVCGGDHWTKDHAAHTSDPRLAALAAALNGLFDADDADWLPKREEQAAAILAALDEAGWAMVRDEGNPWSGREKKDAEIARVREENALYKEVLNVTKIDGVITTTELEALRLKAQENERLTDELSGCNSCVLDLLAANARLRKIEEAARAHIAWEYRVRGAPRFTMSDLRAALGDEP